IEHRIVHKNGMVRWVRNTFVPHRDERGALVSYDGLIQDITGRKHAEEALGRSEATLRSLFLAAPVGVSIVKNRVIQSMNAYWYEHFGYTEQNLIGKSARMFYSSDKEFDRVGQALYGQLQEHGVASVETKLRRSDGVFCDVI